MFTYTGNPADSDKDAVRFLIQDTDPDDYFVEDEEITFALAEETNIYRAAALVAERIAAKFARKPGSYVRGRIEVRNSTISEQFQALADRLRNQGTGVSTLSSLSAFAGGISVADKESTETDTDRVEPAFRMGQFDAQ